MPAPSIPAAIAAPGQRLRALALQALAALLLAMIGLQATNPATPASFQQHGSAFSALTADVTLAPRQQDQASQRLAPLPYPLPTLPAVRPLPALLPYVANPAPVPVAQSPPPPAPRLRAEVPASPRAPPHA